MNDSLEKVIKSCQEKNRKAQEEIYLQFSPVLFSICLRYAENYEDAQDTFQEGFVIIFNKIDQFKFQGSFEGWMKRIMINLSLEKIKKKNTISFDDYENHLQLAIDNESNDLPQGYNYQQILETVQHLPPQYRQVFNLYIFEEYSHQEIAELLQISVGTSKSNLSRAKNLLKQKLILLKPITDEKV